MVLLLKQKEMKLTQGDDLMITHFQICLNLKCHTLADRNKKKDENK